MDNPQEEHFGTLLKVSNFLGVNSAELAINPAIAASKVKVDGDISDIVAQDVIANTDNEGYTAAKGAARTELIESVFHVGTGLTGYYRVPLNREMLGKVDQPKSFYQKASEAELNTEAEIIHKIADPVKALLAPNLVSAAQVDGLNTKRLAFLAMIKVPREKIGDGKAARKEMGRLFKLSAEHLEELDDLMAVYETVDPVLFSKYRSARAIDNFGGGSGTDGFTMQTFIIPPGGTYTISESASTIPPDSEIYIRSIQGNEIICTTNIPNMPCASGYSVMQGVTFKGAISGLSLDLNNPILQITNPGIAEAIVRFGFKN